MSNYSNLDPNQIIQAQFDADNRAQRVILVGGENLNITATAVEQKSSSVEVIKVPEIIKETQIVEVQKLVEQQKIERIEVPVVIKEIEYKEIHIPIIQNQVQLVEIEKFIEVPKIVEIVKEKHLSKMDRTLLIANGVILLGIFIMQIIK